MLGTVFWGFRMISLHEKIPGIQVLPFFSSHLISSLLFSSLLISSHLFVGCQLLHVDSIVRHRLSSHNIVCLVQHF